MVEQNVLFAFSVITNKNNIIMKELQVNFPNELAFLLRMNEVEFSYEMKKLALIKLYELGKISSGKAASLLGLTKVGFIGVLNQYEVSIFEDLDATELQEELNKARKVGLQKK
jgi:predicted HTH domain antitoxin